MSGNLPPGVEVEVDGPPLAPLPAGHVEVELGSFTSSSVSVGLVTVRAPDSETAQRLAIKLREVFDA